MLTIEMVRLLSCPTCKRSGLRAEIENQEGNSIEVGMLLCQSCYAGYPVQQGVPDLIPKSELSSEAWSIWAEHLGRLKARRDKRKIGSIRLKRTSKGKSHRSFFDFVKIDEGNVLDVGCGPGKLRKYLAEERVTYFGLDPLPTPEVRDFRFVRALAEHIPFKESTFSDILVISSLDHFNNIQGFFEEAVRVLRLDGQIHLYQPIHEVRGPISVVEELSHVFKDAFDNYRTKKQSRAPKHMTEFRRSSLQEILAGYFEIVSIMEHHSEWYTPKKLFLTMRPKEVGNQTLANDHQKEVDATTI